MNEERAHELLDAARDRIESELARLADANPEQDEGDDPASLASDTYEREFDEGRIEDLRRELEAVERAEARLANGTYGLSVESGDVIPDARLEIRPTAELTVEEERRRS